MQGHISPNATPRECARYVLDNYYRMQALSPNYRAKEIVLAAVLMARRFIVPAEEEEIRQAAEAAVSGRSGEANEAVVQLG